MSVWITRSAPDNLATARRLRAVGIRPLLFPVIETRALSQSRLSLRPDAIVFSSVHAVRHHVRHEELFAVPVVVRSEEIANAARQAGYFAITSTAGDEAMLHEVLARVVPARGHALYLCAARTSGMLEAALLERGRQVERRPVYLPVEREPGGLSPLVERLSRVNAIVLHSSVGHATVREVIAAAGWRGPIWCISPQSADPFRNLAGIAPRVAAAPTEQALIEMVCSQVRREPEADSRDDLLAGLAQTRRKRPIGWPARRVHQGRLTVPANDDDEGPAAG